MHRTLAWLPIAAAAWAMHAFSATPETPSFRCPVPGTTIVTTKGITVAEQAGAPMHCVSVQNGVQTDTIAQIVEGNDQHATELADEIGKLWPLVVGDERVFYVGLPDEPLVNHVAVTRRAAIDTPAGHFDTYVIEWSRFGANCGAILDEVHRYYYAPSLGAVVRYERDYGYGGDKFPDPAARWEALAIRVPDDGAPVAMSQRDPRSPYHAANQ